MLFSSSIFLFLFLPLVIIGYKLLKEKYRMYFLMLASLFFYAWGEPKYILVMLLSIAINYGFGLLLHASKQTGFRKVWLALAVVCNLGILFYFKYLNFTITSVNKLLHTGFATRDIVMPIGISFFTFQGMSYVIDLYYNKVKVQKNPAIVAFYISFFPQLIAGPIVRYIDIEDQIISRTESFEKFTDGAKRFIVGLSKKVIIANTLGYTADLVFRNPILENSAPIAWIGIICYTFQIFFDFSGYSDMAIGLGRLFGYEFLENFNYPYISKTITEFWRRWHISLSTWFRDYVYIPLGGNRKGNVYVNLAIVFIITGFWHGASFNFLLWGVWHGLFLILERAFKLTKVEKKGLVPLRYALTMLVVVIGWVFFRVEGLPDAFRYLGIMFGLVQPTYVGFTPWFYLDTKTIIMLAIAAIASIPIANTKLLAGLRRYAAWQYVTAALSVGLLLLSMVFIIASTYNPFIYFRF